MNENIPWNVVILLWIAIWQFLLFASQRRDNNSRGWWKLDFFKKESFSSMVQKIYSFNEGYNPKVITDDKGIITEVNLAVENLFETKKLDLIGRSVNKLIPECFNTENLNKLTFGITQKKSGIKLPLEYVIRKKDIDEITYYIVEIRDLTRETKQKEACEAQIMELEEMLEILTNEELLQSTGGWHWNLKTKMITVTPGYQKILGLEKSKLRIEDIKSKVWDEDKEIVNEALDRAFKGENYDITFRLMRFTDIKVIFVRSIVKPVVNEDAVVVSLFGSMRLLQTKNIREASQDDDDD